MRENRSPRSGDVFCLLVPCFNEDETLKVVAPVLCEKMVGLIESGAISEKSCILFVDDGSTDSTWQIIEHLAQSNQMIRGLKLSRNFGHQNALLAGMSASLQFSDVIISMDADLQDDVNAIDKMLADYSAGSEIVYAVRSSRESDSKFKKSTAQSFYKLMNALGASVVYNHADFRLMSKRAVEELLKFTEVNLFLRGLVPLLGFKSSKVEYTRAKRVAGESKYPLKKMLKFAFDGVTSFSVKPLRLVTILGFLTFFCGILGTVYSVVQFFRGDTTIGWASTICSIWLLGGVQMISLGLIGEYVGKIFSETKRRPRFIVEELI
ncbi:MAG: glycosyltransferase family 2 protein [Candidatus Ancillula sp.]|jgi:glycosyltransferase involved in cell wall biosynthesis|nr:glycosyltransferase family 2 protein [Candidatus Ancillula sp.]